ncbi:unnamed protein product [Echinostoma caproni]|uniref:Focal adhesion kinase 1 n=1 Tax=Echinostoma caproni TaxID=27848 RepID=A0A183AQB7_9TREM|nr:unnamed protein product [Echinostoma caproni]
MVPRNANASGNGSISSLHRSMGEQGDHYSSTGSRFGHHHHHSSGYSSMHHSYQQSGMPHPHLMRGQQSQQQPQSHHHGSSEPMMVGDDGATSAGGAQAPNSLAALLVPPPQKQPRQHLATETTAENHTLGGTPNLVNSPTSAGPHGCNYQSLMMGSGRSGESQDYLAQRGLPSSNANHVHSTTNNSSGR